MNCLPRNEARTRQTILDRLNTEAPGLRRKYGVKSLAVFGSIARGDDRDGSDADVLVKFEGKATFDNFMGLGAGVISRRLRSACLDD
jgi:predicted nucleotidyltransferase